MYIYIMWCCIRFSERKKNEFNLSKPLFLALTVCVLFGGCCSTKKMRLTGQKTSRIRIYITVSGSPPSYYMFSESSNKDIHFLLLKKKKRFYVIVRLFFLRTLGRKKIEHFEMPITIPVYCVHRVYNP